jgi:hypothetical protein
MIIQRINKKYPQQTYKKLFLNAKSFIKNTEKNKHYMNNQRQNEMNDENVNFMAQQNIFSKASIEFQCSEMQD